MSDFFYATVSNIKRFRNLLETSVDETERTEGYKGSSHRK
jgi:hypothetical protein